LDGLEQDIDELFDEDSLDTYSEEKNKLLEGEEDFEKKYTFMLAEAQALLFTWSMGEDIRNGGIKDSKVYERVLELYQIEFEEFRKNLKKIDKDKGTNNSIRFEYSDLVWSIKKGKKDKLYDDLISKREYLLHSAKVTLNFAGNYFKNLRLEDIKETLSKGYSK